EAGAPAPWSGEMSGGTTPPSAWVHDQTAMSRIVVGETTVDNPRAARIDSGHSHRRCSMANRSGSWTRRDFLRTAALASGTVAAGTPLPVFGQAAKPAESPKLGAQLIGKLEGPELILDPAKWPKKFSEAPMLAELVKAGKLPPVEQRVPPEPLGVK